MQTSRRGTRSLRRSRIASRQGFTLVELLVVIAIIGVLVGLTVPAVMIGLRAVKQRSIAMECIAIANSVEAYHNKYGEYPPDGADPALFARHLRKAFPNIAPSEIALLTGSLTPSGNPAVSAAGGTGGVMDPPEALVFFLGGFSDDPVFPFSGKDGPFYILDTSGTPTNSVSTTIASIQYNPDRKNAFYEFKQAQLTLGVSPSALTVSTDDAISGGKEDLLPVYHPNGLTMPFVYFESRTYQQTTIANRYETVANGIVYPYRSAAVNTKYSTDMSIAGRNKYYRFMNEKSFQLISAGLDDHFGGVSGYFFVYKPSGASTDSGTGPSSGDSIGLVDPMPIGKYTRFKDAAEGTEQGDNVANFADGTFEDSLTN